MGASAPRSRRSAIAAEPKAPAPPDAPDVAPSLSTDAPAGAEWSQLLVEDRDLRDHQGSSLLVEGSRIAQSDLGGATLHGARFMDVELHRSNLANVQARGIELVRCELVGCRLTGARLSEGRLTDVLLRECRIDLATFAGSTFERVTFEGCLMTGSEFQSVTADSLRLESCELVDADFSGARFARTEMRRCNLDRLQGIDGLRGVAMEWNDLLAIAPLLAAAFEIGVVE